MKRAINLRLLWPACWWAAIAALLALHWAHLRADFPNFSPWMDYAKYTDEGWYGNAAIRHKLFGYWRFAGDFNPAVALPVWPLFLRAAFAVGGVSQVTARSLSLGLFVLNLLLSYLLLRRSSGSQVVALAGVTFLAASAYLWAFSRLAILEPLLVFFVLFSWVAALALGPRSPSPSDLQGDAATPAPGKRGRIALLLATGLLVALAILTKTTAIFLIPSTLYLIKAANRHALRPTILDTAMVAAGGILPWTGYYLLVVRPHYAVDYHYLFAANHWTQPTSLQGWFWAFWYALHGTLWIDPTLCGIAAVVVLFGFLGRPRIWEQPLAVASALAAAGYIFFTGWHNNPQPRYYEVVAYPLVFIACLGAAALTTSDPLRWPRLLPARWPRRLTLWWPRMYSLRRGLGLLAWIAFATTIAGNVYGTLHFVRHPDYSFVRAARGITRYIDRHPNGRRLLLSISGDEIMLVTHLPAICDDFGSTDLPYRIHRYQPGWYAAWNEIDPGTLEDLRSQYSLEQVAKFHAFDDEDRDVLILYKLHPLPAQRLNYNAEEEEAANRKLQ